MILRQTVAELIDRIIILILEKNEITGWRTKREQIID